MSHRDFINKMLAENEAIFARCKDKIAYFEIKDDQWINEKHFSTEDEIRHFTFYKVDYETCFSIIEHVDNLVSFRFEDEGFLYKWVNNVWKVMEYHNFIKEDEQYAMVTDEGVVDDLVRLMKKIA